MSWPLILAVAIIYLIIALDNYLKGDGPHALIWVSYSIANFGFVWYEITKEIQ